MMLHIPQVLKPQQVAECRQVLQQAKWVDGRQTAGATSAQVKNNLQLPTDSAEAQRLGQTILAALERNALFMSAALPRRVLAPRFNCHQAGQSYGLHVDNAVQRLAGGELLRSDLSATLFLSAPEEYQGGELEIVASLATHSIKLAAGDLLLYPSTSLHQVCPVTQGTRLCAFFWLQSMVRDAEQRRLLFELDQSVQQLSRELGHGHASVVQLTGVYSNLVRQWAEI
ncbi:Fe2+-dependent dioxygenase [Aquipseudomonas alcaligenes]|uniref:Fe2+-dependent dioxygenase n=1 Tax=Aquipseudomonas alcaligenes TaxID=43263 RepID=A0A2V4L698_AQUAC|nr:Fe2+-dependent dioxygenase [Pseudomonas alcaligenes]PYC29495.1 Fe2+-dependent dioxygenase [Pseudomonas alcaligenes]